MRFLIILLLPLTIFANDFNETEFNKSLDELMGKLKVFLLKTTSFVAELDKLETNLTKNSSQINLLKGTDRDLIEDNRLRNEFINQLIRYNLPLKYLLVVVENGKIEIYGKLLKQHNFNKLLKVIRDFRNNGIQIENYVILKRGVN